MQIGIERFLILRPGDAAPEFAATTLDGKPVKLGDLKGKVVLLDFWATWCAPCIAEMPGIQRAWETYGADGSFVVLGITLDDDKEYARRFMKERKHGWPQIGLGPAEENPIAKKYNVTGIPAMVLIGPDGKVVTTDVHGAKLQQELAKLMPKIARSDKKK